MASSRQQQTRLSRRSCRISYAEPSSDISSDSDDSSPARKRPRRSLRGRDHVHRASSISSLNSEFASSSPGLSTTQSVRVDILPRKITSQSQSGTRSRGVKPFTSFSSLKRVKAISQAASTISPKAAWTSAPTARIPPWQTLPYQILLEIMQYAAYPFYHGASRDTGNVRWLLNVSELCSTFHEACISALTTAPPLFPASRAHWLIGLLKASGRRDEPHCQHAKPQTSLDYRSTLR